MPGRKNDSETVEQRRERVILLHVGGKSPREIAEVEGLSLSQVYRDIKDSSEELRGGLLRGDMAAATRLIMVAQEIGARALREGRYGAALRALEMEVRIRVLVPSDQRGEQPASPKTEDSWFIFPEEAPDSATRDPVLGGPTRQRGG